MRPSTVLATASLLIGFAATAANPPVAAGRDTGGVLIYRCSDAQGRLSLRDSPCPAGSRQTVRSMQRPVDGAPLARTAPIGTPVSPQQSTPVLAEPSTAPQPLYTCLTPDGERYVSESAEGNPRAVPLWTLRYGPLSRQFGVGTPGSLQAADTWGDDRGRSGEAVVVATTDAGGNALVWVRDACSALTQAQACAHLRTQRDELGRRAFNAQPSARDRLESERRGLIARIQSEC